MSSFDIFENLSGLFVACLEDFVEFENFGLFWSDIFSPLNAYGSHIMHRSIDLVLLL